jgi:transposase
MSQSNESRSSRIIALDVGDRRTELARREGGVIVHEELRTSRDALRARFTDEPPCTVAFEAGSQSAWMAWLLTDLGHRPLVIHPKRLKVITQSFRKTDRTDAEWLLRLAEAEADLLGSVRVRSRAQQVDLALLRTREQLTSMRAAAILSVRSQAKLFGAALPSGGPAAFPRRARAGLPPDVLRACEPLIVQIEQITDSLKRIERTIESLAEQRYPETACLTQVPSIGPLTALTAVLTLQSSDRFTRSREVGPAVGLVPKQRASGSRDPELRITKLGDPELRRLLVLAAHRIARNSAPDSDLKRFGERLMARGGKNARKRAIVAVARKLAVLLVALWKSGEVYQPLRHAETAATV